MGIRLIRPLLALLVFSIIAVGGAYRMRLVKHDVEHDNEDNANADNVVGWRQLYPERGRLSGRYHHPAGRQRQRRRRQRRRQ